ncbi:helix-turn-helix domain-containing protein [Paenibacillus shunpengii]|uniref:Helix-turn-helix domain-containing protein n=1 Tax=Paenibacillus shunpengii TaxID=2054424 RepID=A0ABW5SN64_9BACL
MHEVILLGSEYPLVRDIGTTYTQGRWIHPERVADYHVCIYCIQGQMQVVEDGKEYILRDGDIMFLKKGVHHWGSEGTLPGTSTLWIHFYDSPNNQVELPATEQTSLHQMLFAPTDQLFSKSQYECTVVLPKLMNIKGFPHMNRKARELYELYSSSRPFRHLYVSLETMSLFLEIYRISLMRHIPGKSDALVQKLARYLEEHCEEELDIERIKSTFQRNYNYLSTLFKAKLGTSIFCFHERQRIMKAAELLKNTSMNITEVSYALQFNSPYYFSRVFKKVMGESPTDYIKNIYRMK